MGAPPEFEGPPGHSGSLTGLSLGAPMGAGPPPGLPAAVASYRDSEGLSPSSVSLSPVSSDEMPPTGPPAPEWEAQGGVVVAGAPGGGPRLQGGLRLQGVPKLAIPRLGGGGGPSSPPPEADGSPSSPQRRVPWGPPSVRGPKEGISPRAPPRSTGPPPTRSTDTGAPSAPLSREDTLPSLSIKLQQQQQQQRIGGGACLSGVSLGALANLGGAPSSPPFAESLGDLQRRGSDGSNAGTARETPGSRRRRTEEVSSCRSSSSSSSRGTRRSFCRLLLVVVLLLLLLLLLSLLGGKSIRSSSNSSSSSSRVCVAYLVFDLAIVQDGIGLYSRTRQQQLARFRRVISDVYNGRLFVAGAAAACDQKVTTTPPINTPTHSSSSSSASNSSNRNSCSQRR